MLPASVRSGLSHNVRQMVVWLAKVCLFVTDSAALACCSEFLVQPLSVPWYDVRPDASSDYPAFFAHSYAPIALRIASLVSNLGANLGASLVMVWGTYHV